MKRFHVHVHVADLEHNIGFYSQLFGTEPTVRKADYAKWLLDDPQLNFAISSGKSEHTGIAHLGLQAGEAAELAEIGERLQAADAIALAETATTCCYALGQVLGSRSAGRSLGELPHPRRRHHLPR